MIIKFLNWSHDQGGLGAATFIFVGTLMCCTGLIFPVLAFDIISNADWAAPSSHDQAAQEKALRKQAVDDACAHVAKYPDRFENRTIATSGADSIVIVIALAFLAIGLFVGILGLWSAA